jgi:hypothetical protein
MTMLEVPEHLQLRDHRLRLLLYTLFALIVADGLITKFLVGGSYGSEANPFLEAWVGQDIFLTMKVSGAFLATLFLWIKHSRNPRSVFTITLLSVAFYTVVIFWNLFVFLTT